MTGDDKAGEAAKHKWLTNRQYLLAMQANYQSEQDVQDVHEQSGACSQAIAEACTLLLATSSAKGQPQELSLVTTEDVKDYVKRLTDAREALERHFPPGQRGPVVRLLTILGSKIHAVHRRHPEKSPAVRLLPRARASQPVEFGLPRVSSFGLTT